MYVVKVPQICLAGVHVIELNCLEHLSHAGLRVITNALES